MGPPQAERDIMERSMSGGGHGGAAADCSGSLDLDDAAALRGGSGGAAAASAAGSADGLDVSKVLGRPRPNPTYS